MKAICQRCSKEFTVYPNRIKIGEGKFCSKKCQGLSERIRIERKCQICDKIFIARPSDIKYHGAKYCSRDCRRRGQIGKKKPNCSGDKIHTWKGGITLQPKFCMDCGKKLGDHRSLRCQSCAKKADLHPNWKDGIANFPYSPSFTAELKSRIRQRDNYECQLCNLTEEEHIVVYGRNLCPHHIDYDKQNSDETNLITLCNQCNLRVNYNRTYWTEIFVNKIKEKYNEKVIS